MSALVTAAEAQALLDALSAPRGRHSLNCHTHRDCDGCRDDDRRDSLRHHNAAPLARTVVAQAAEVATLRAAYAQDLDGLRAELRRADDERAAWRERVEAAERETLRLRSLLPAVAFIRCPTCGTDRDAELDDDAVYVMRRHPRRTTRDGYDEMMWCDGGIVSEVKP